MEKSTHITEHITKRITDLVGEGWTLEAEITIPHVGWELDNYAWAVRDKHGNVQWVYTDHGWAKQTSKKELSVILDERSKIVAQSLETLKNTEA